MEYVNKFMSRYNNANAIAWHHLRSEIYGSFFYFPTHDWLSIIWSIKEDDQAPAIISLAWLWHHFHLAFGDCTGSNPQPSDREPSALPLDHGFRTKLQPSTNHKLITITWNWLMPKTKTYIVKLSKSKLLIHTVWRKVQEKKTHLWFMDRESLDET